MTDCSITANLVEKPFSDAIIVLGMHRSGTSVVAEMLQAMGIYVGSKEELIPPANDNPNGFFERYDIVKTNFLLLKYFGSNWHSNLNAWNPQAFTANTTANEDFKQRFRIILSKLSEHAPFLVKDPRFCLTLPVWKQVLQRSFVVFVYRHPVEVARSLEKRNGFSLEYGLALWEFYTIYAFRCLAEMDCTILVVDYSELLSCAEGVASRLHASLTDFGTKVDALSTAQIHRIINPDLYHCKTITNADTILSDNQKSLMSAIANGVATKWKPGDVPQLSSSSKQLLEQNLH
eukprot:CAMPEP_0168578456 /NCGR_PEP_ID=MMETSP0413-20121227/21341_1 /TAXON_ID=136452 /ORGANISM="Filamoeba nolandi, Strain NC-AS-23-1" /LENGTH=289 /DNA_ID=CAMNT_0008612301 /DNA_START=128 /DNA_END=997 /DNA_ORIENTATION=-